MMGLDPTNASLTQLPFGGGILEQPIYEFQIWQIFFGEFKRFKKEEDDRHDAEMKNKMPKTTHRSLRRF